MVIVFNYKEHQFGRILVWTHVVVLTVGIGMACASIPFISPLLGVCFIAQPPAIDSLLPRTLLYTVPVVLVLFGLTLSTAIVCRFVYNQQRRSARWSLSQKRTATVTRKVFWQSFWYVLAFYTTFPLSLIHI